MIPRIGPDPLERVLETYRADAAVLRRCGHPVEADRIEECMAAVESAAEEYLRWLSEDEAKLRSGKGAEWLRRHFPSWEAAGHARRNGKTREYRMLVVPQRSDIHLMREGQRIGLEAA